MRRDGWEQNDQSFRRIRVGATAAAAITVDFYEDAQSAREVGGHRRRACPLPDPDFNPIDGLRQVRLGGSVLVGRDMDNTIRQR